VTLKVQVTVNGVTSWSQWSDEMPRPPVGTPEQQEWVRKRALKCFLRSLERIGKAK